jgi:Uma2 family endonuclease
VPIGTIAGVQAVMLEVPEALLAERRRLGHDRFDEMWEGVLHMVPPPGTGHQRLEAWLVERWAPLARAHGLWVTTETGLFDPAVADFSSYRQPDVAVFTPEHAGKRGIEGRAELVVEVRSPDDEAYQKLPFYERVGVQEVLVVERDFNLRHWVRQDDKLVEVPLADGSSPLSLRALPVILRRPEAGVLAMDTPDGTTTFDERHP